MRLKKVNQNTSKLFCALFMLGMNVYGVDRQQSVYGQQSVNGQTSFNGVQPVYGQQSVVLTGNGQFNGQPFVNGVQSVYGQQSVVLTGNGQQSVVLTGNGQPFVNGPQNQGDVYQYTAPTGNGQFNGQQFFNDFDRALTNALAGNKSAMSIIKVLTIQDSDMQPTIEMWRDACKKAIHATMQGNSYGLEIFKYFTSDACYTKSNATGSDIWGLMIKSETAGSDFLQLIMNGTAKIAQNEQNKTIKSSAHDLSFAILTYLTSQDCKVPPAQEGVDQLFREKAHQYVERKREPLKGRATTFVVMKNEAFEPTYVINYLAGKHCGVPPSQKEVDSFFGKLIKAYTETKSFGLEALESTRDRFFSAIIHLISNKCNRHPSPDMVQHSIKTLTQADSKRKDDINSAILNLESESTDIKSNQITKSCNLSIIDTYRTSLKDCELLYLQEILTIYLNTLPEVPEHILEADSKKFFKYCENQSETLNKVMNIIKTVNPQEQFTI
jgi:hypothetical protein